MGIMFDGNVNFNNTNNNSLKTSDLKIGQIDPELSQIGKMLGKQQKNIQINPEYKMPEPKVDIPEGLNVDPVKMPEPKVNIPEGLDVDPVKMPEPEIEIPKIDKPNNKTLL